jgi:hypothetical protein
MLFVKEHLSGRHVAGHVLPPFGVWKCLTSAMMLREPVLVFPVSDLTTFAPMPGLNKASVEDPSLPSKGMIQCIEAAGGSPPSCWNMSEQVYSLTSKTRERGAASSSIMKLRDVLLMKPGSTVEDVFLTLKRLGAVSGEFVRAEACSGKVGEKPKPIPKAEIMCRKVCVIRIMSNKRTAWQKS